MPKVAFDWDGKIAVTGSAAMFVCEGLKDAVACVL